VFLLSKWQIVTGGTTMNDGELVLPVKRDLF